MSPPTVDPYDTVPAWWEADCVRWGMSYTPVRTRLMALMSSHIVRLMDRKYMMQLTSRLQEDHEARQRVRIEQRKLQPPTIVPELWAMTGELSKRAPRRRYRGRCASKLDAKAAKKCKQLPRLLLDDSQPPKHS